MAIWNDANVIFNLKYNWNTNINIISLWLNGHLDEIDYQTGNVDAERRICSCQHFLLDWCKTTCNESLCRYNKRWLCLWFSATPNTHHTIIQHNTTQHSTVSTYTWKESSTESVPCECVRVRMSIEYMHSFLTVWKPM